MKFGILAYATVVVAAVVGFACSAEGQTYNVLYNFGTVPGDGASPSGSLILSGSTLYGMTTYGGSAGVGNIISYDLSTNTESVLHNFQPGTSDGSHPFGSLLLSGSTLYGTTGNGGAQAQGTVFGFNTANNAYNFYSFAGSPNDGAGPQGSLVQSGATLYGMTTQGGANIRGTICAYDPVQNTESSLYSFGGSASDGIIPTGSLTQSGSIFYGMTELGGRGNGTIFSFNSANDAETPLYSFGTNPNDGMRPQGSLIQSGSVLYGLAPDGGAYGKGALFAFDTSTNMESVLYSFRGKNGDGAEPQGSLIQSGSMLYGMTSVGGMGAGTIFSFDTSTDSLAILHAFNGGDGGFPDGDLMFDGNTLYGMAGLGNRSSGVMFSLDLPEPGCICLLAFAGCGLLLRRRRHANA